MCRSAPTPVKPPPSWDGDACSSCRLARAVVRVRTRFDARTRLPRQRPAVPLCADCMELVAVGDEPGADRWVPGDEQVRRDVPTGLAFVLARGFGWRRGFVTACVRQQSRSELRWGRYRDHAAPKVARGGRISWALGAEQ
jgi:hypothetical protein